MSQFSNGHTNTSDNVCYLGSSHCDVNEAYTARMWRADSRTTSQRCSTWYAFPQIKAVATYRIHCYIFYKL